MDHLYFGLYFPHVSSRRRIVLYNQALSDICVTIPQLDELAPLIC